MGKKVFWACLIILGCFVSPSFAQEDVSYCTTTQGSIERNVFGIADLSLQDPVSVKFLKDLGIEWVRVEMRWDRIQPEQQKYQWGEMDGIVERLRSADIKILALVNHPPVWAHPIETFDKDFSEFMRNIVQRYTVQGVHYWEIFNEPNLPGYGWPFRYEDRDFAIRFYSRVLETANIVIRKIDKDAVIFTAGFSPDGIDPFYFLEGLYQTVGSKCFDVYAFHPYGSLHKLPVLSAQIREIMARYGDGKKPIWYNEFGTGDDSERAELLKILSNQINDVDGFIWFTLHDWSRFGWNYGLLEYNWEKKSDYDFFKEIYTKWKNNRRKTP